MTRRAEEPHPQLQDIEARRQGRRVPESFAVTPETARADFADRLDGLTEYVDDEADEVQRFEVDGPAGPLPITAFLPEGDGPHPVVVFYHGGGFVIGSPETHANICHALADRAGVVVLSVDYRLAPEHTFPAAVRDAYAALEWAGRFAGQVGGDPDRLAVVGSSAGGNLATAVSMLARERERDGPTIDRQLLIYPWLDPAGRFDLDSYTENPRENDAAEGYLFEQYGNYLKAGNEYLAPLIARDLSGLPPATIVTGGFDRLRDEGVEYAERLETAGVEADLVNYPAMNHGFLSLLGLVDRADDAMDRLVADLDETFGGV